MFAMATPVATQRATNPAFYDRIFQKAKAYKFQNIG